MKVIVSLVAMLGALVLIHCSPVGSCSAGTQEQVALQDGGTVTCTCKGACGCFFEDGGRCP